MLGTYYANKNEQNNEVGVVKSIVAIINFVILILMIIWLFAVIRHADNEPEAKSKYIFPDNIQQYTEGDFCFGHYYEYLKTNAYKVFNIKNKKIKKFARGLLATKFISIFLNLIMVIFTWAVKKVSSDSSVNYVSIGLLILLLYLANLVLGVVFFEKLMNYYNSANFHDFKTFWKCSYLNKLFRRDYKYLKKLDKNLGRVSTLNLISSIAEAINIF